MTVVAHKLACKALEIGGFHCWADNPPYFVVSLICSEALASVSSLHNDFIPFHKKI